MSPTVRHLWVAGPHPAGRAAALAAHAGGLRVDCHRYHRGPYTGTGTVLRALVPGADPDLVSRHRIEILCAAPELDGLVGGAPGTLTSLASPDERTRWYSRLRTRRIAHGLVEFLRALACAGSPLTLGLGGLDEADPTDQEFVAIALRRLDPALVRVVVETGRGRELPAELAGALARHAEPVPSPAPAAPGGQADGADDGADDEALARTYVDSDGTGDGAAERAAYDRLDPERRAALHDARAEEIEGRDEFSLRLGALAYHRLHGSDPDAAWAAASAVQEYCLGMGFYAAVLEHGDRLERLLETDRARYSTREYAALMRYTQASALLELPELTERIYRRILASTDHPVAHMTIHYAIGMLYTRYYEEERRDHVLARSLVNTAVALASQLEDPEQRAFHTVFMRNGLALIEMHLGNLDRSLELVSSGIDRLDRELAPDRHMLHRSVLRHNRAQVLAALGRGEEATVDFDAVIELDPHYAEYHFDRGNARSKAGDHAGAIADYEHAMTLTPPFPELYYNRGDQRLALGDADGALADFGYVLELEPDHLEARISLASVLLDAGAAGAALAAARDGLDHHPDEARLWCLVGQAAAGVGRRGEAFEAFDQALRADPACYEALVARAALHHDGGAHDAAVADLDAALEIAGDDPDLLFNRGYVLEAAGRYARALADYDRAMDLPGADRDELLARRGTCHAAMGDPVTA